MTDSAIVIFCTAPTQDGIAARLAQGLVEAELAACVNVAPAVRSFYRWQGQVQVDDELLLIIKTRRELFDAVAEWLKQQHPYDVPEVIALPIEAGSTPYLHWLFEQTPVRASRSTPERSG